jgi:hypothetical protein
MFWTNAVLKIQENGIKFEPLKLHQIVLFCFRVDCDAVLVRESDRQSIRELKAILLEISESKPYIEILSSTEIPKPSEMKLWIDANMNAAKKLEDLGLILFLSLIETK